MEPTGLRPSSNDGLVNEFLVIYLDSIDERVLDYLDEDDVLRPEVVKRLRYTPALWSTAPSSPGAVAEDRADWFDLVGAFVAAYAPEATEELALFDAFPMASRRSQRAGSASLAAAQLQGLAGWLSSR